MNILIFLVAVSAAFAFPSAENLEGYTFDQFLIDANKSYDSTEYALRKQIFTLRLQDIMEHNAHGLSWLHSVNQFADMTQEEVRAFNGYNHGMAITSLQNSRKYERTEHINSTLPDSVDWRAKGVVSPVKNQQSCGSCWAFASAETLESHDAIRNGRLKILSPQELVDCAPNPNHCGGTGGCEGATGEVAYAYVQGNGMAAEADYPYTARDGTCKKESTSRAAGVEYYVRLPENDADAVAEALANKGPMAVAVDASHWSFYSKGIFDGCSFDKNIEIDHLVQLVGYGTENGKDYWLIRNSWGTGWGEDGYIRIRRYPSGTCGEDRTPLDGSGCNGSPDSVMVCGNCGVVYDVVYPVPAVL